MLSQENNVVYQLFMFKWFFEDDKMIIDHIKGLMVAENEGKRPENENVVIILSCTFKD